MAHLRQLFTPKIHTNSNFVYFIKKCLQCDDYICGTMIILLYVPIFVHLERMLQLKPALTGLYSIYKERGHFSILTDFCADERQIWLLLLPKSWMIHTEHRMPNIF